MHRWLREFQVVGGRWAIDAVVTPTTAKVNWGLTALPDFADACDGGRIAVPAGLFSAARINQEISRRTNGEILLNGGNSPMRAAVDVAAAHLSARAPGGHRIVLVITDGEPDCAPGASDTFASDASGTVQAVTNAASLGISTTVIGVATAGGPAEATLAAMARAGDATRVDVCPRREPRPAHCGNDRSGDGRRGLHARHSRSADQRWHHLEVGHQPGGGGSDVADPPGSEPHERMGLHG